MSAVIHTMPDPARLRAGKQAVTERAAQLGASKESLRKAVGILIREMQAGRSAAASVALANSSMRREVCGEPKLEA